jgi:hypothetical protein
LLLRLLPVALIACACRGPAAPPPPDIGKDLTPKGATMVAVARGDNPNVWERSFTVQAVYPALGIGEDGFGILRKQGWKPCESDYDKWMSHVDRMRQPAATIHERWQYWRRGNDMMKILFKYRVDEGAEVTAAAAQRVTLYFFGAQTAEEMDRWNRTVGSCAG